MLEGRFGGTTRRPYVEGRLILLGDQQPTSDVSFLIDTGADSTMLMPADAVRMGIDFGQFRRQTEAVGIGGTARTFVERAAVVFSEPRRFLLDPHRGARVQSVAIPQDHVHRRHPRTSDNNPSAASATCAAVRP